MLAAAAGPAHAGDLFKCGTTFQDRPCADRAVQQRFSLTQGEFAIQQVNPDTDRDCARVAADAMGWWQRMAAGETKQRLNAEIQARPIERQQKSLLRDVLNVLGEMRGQPVEVRSQLESRCMAYKRNHGYATEREVARSTDADVWRAEAEARRAEAEARQAEARARFWR
ncbi:hypothetical protein HHL11_30635 [Ramlibacter sp. G-1-2-2]|uniref:Uncharacterized protein n=1 Tax=Ramlibacter agri TaxID=2728837 RepID=A0A848HAT7_9BURK|nr:hypothetical protein [Ramlibacter agri]NML48146.1 hypothetical protein [Ramlibacter agri]